MRVYKIFTITLMAVLMISVTSAYATVSLQQVGWTAMQTPGSGNKISSQGQMDLMCQLDGDAGWTGTAGYDLKNWNGSQAQYSMWECVLDPVCEQEGDWMDDGAGEWYCGAAPTFCPGVSLGDELDVGRCAAPVPLIPPPSASLTNGEKDGDEDGVDCGGSTGVECQVGCGAGQTVLIDPAGPSAFNPSGNQCGTTTSPDAQGNCPAGTMQTETSCVALAGFNPVPPYGSDAYIQSLNIPAAAPAPEFSTGTFTVTTMPEVVVDNGDGTETVSIDVIKLDTDTGKSTTSTTTLTRPSGSDAGTGFGTPSAPDGPLTINPGYSGTVDGEGDIEDQEENYGVMPVLPPAPEFDGTFELTSEQLARNDYTSLVDDFMATNSLSSSIGSLVVGTENSNCSVSIASTSHTEASFSMPSLEFGLCRWETELQGFGTILLSIVSASSILIVIAGWRQS